MDFKEREGVDEGVDLSFLVEGEMKRAHAEVVVGADGISREVGRVLLGEDAAPLCYRVCVVILGLCSVQVLQGVERGLLVPCT